MGLTPKAPRWSVFADQRITRRKLFHIVCDTTGEPVFRSRLMSECFDYLRAAEVDTFTLHCPESPALLLSFKASEINE